ncbi:MAG: ATP-dependent zinc protease [Gammaproteobacteria bacterium]
MSLPDIGIPAIKAKIDTGARTSALHAFRIEPFEKNGKDHIRFWLHPLRKKRQIELVCEAEVADKRIVKDSGGHTEERYVIETGICVGDLKWDIELTLTSREDMMFRMLLGRTAITAAGLIIDPTASYITGRSLSRIYNKRSKPQK